MLQIHSIHVPLRPMPSRLHFRPLPVFRRHLGLPPKTNQNKCIRQADTRLLLQVSIASESFRSFVKLLVIQKTPKLHFDQTIIHFRVWSCGHSFLVPPPPPPSSIYSSLGDTCWGSVMPGSYGRFPLFKTSPQRNRT